MAWFESWFDTDYYHTLYKHRDDDEAELFIENLFKYFDIEKSNSILDLGCGKGRHSLFMAQKGNEVVGLDLSQNSINLAKEKAILENKNSKLEFIVGDMRDFDLDRKFDYVFNLFTSFGYFDTKEENLEVVRAISKHQKSGNHVVIDFLNSEVVRKNGEMKESKSIDNIEFHTHKFIKNDHIFKDIRVIDNGNEFEFQERVQLFGINEIEALFTKNNYTCIDRFGDFELDSYSDSSLRQILIFRKN